ncbi:unnamed protein product [Thelazia callipaeda]|uniref:IGFBP N-terminal domain-containing protein n=1 Tax=Thelazia callipaeda TaxID=103827 RepID=A0A0N5CKG6_THECL|nr:unnamed protein product [Thelazia callipaeda]
MNEVMTVFELKRKLVTHTTFLLSFSTINFDSQAEKLRITSFMARISKDIPSSRFLQFQWICLIVAIVSGENLTSLTDSQLKIWNVNRNLVNARSKRQICCCCPMALSCCGGLSSAQTAFKLQPPVIPPPVRVMQPIPVPVSIPRPVVVPVPRPVPQPIPMPVPQPMPMPVPQPMPMPVPQPIPMPVPQPAPPSVVQPQLVPFLQPSPQISLFGSSSSASCCACCMPVCMQECINRCTLMGCGMKRKKRTILMDNNINVSNATLH